MTKTKTAFFVFVILAVPAVARADALTIKTSECTRLVQHQPADDVTYRPGVDVRGNAVAPADLGGGYGMDIPEAIDIQIGVDLADRMGLRQTPPGQTPSRAVLPYEGKAPIGTLTVKGNEAYWNGKRLMPQDEALLAEACSKGLAKAGVTLPERKPPVP